MLAIVRGVVTWMAVASIAACSRPASMSRGGVELVFAPVKSDAGAVPITPATLEAARSTIARRLERAKVLALVSTDGEVVRVAMPSSVPAARIAAMRENLGRRALLEFREVRNELLLKLGGRLPPSAKLVQTGPEGQGAVSVEAESRDSASEAVRSLAGGLPAGWMAATEPPSHRTSWAVLLLGPVLIDNDAISEARPVAAEGGKAGVAIALTPKATVAFADATRRLVGRRIAAVLDGVVILAPYVEAPITSGRAQVTIRDATGQEAFARANDLALALNVRAALPVALELVGERAVPSGR